MFATLKKRRGWSGVTRSSFLLVSFFFFSCLGSCCSSRLTLLSDAWQKMKRRAPTKKSTKGARTHTHPHPKALFFAPRCLLWGDGSNGLGLLVPKRRRPKRMWGCCNEEVEKTRWLQGSGSEKTSPLSGLLVEGSPVPEVHGGSFGPETVVWVEVTEEEIDRENDWRRVFNQDTTRHDSTQWGDEKCEEDSRLQ